MRCTPTLLCCLLACACGRAGDGDTPQAQARVRGDGPAPGPQQALAAVAPAPADNAASQAKVALGRLLFWDPILSGDRDVACATCHHPDFGYADGRALSVGAGGRGLGPARQPSAADPQLTPRNAMTVLNVAFNGATAADPSPDPADAPMFWDSRARGLEAQARGPIVARNEMRGAAFTEAEILPEVLARLGALPDYAARFEAAFGAQGLTAPNLLRAISAFERTLVDQSTSYDLFARGEAAALTAAQQRGLATFRSHGCAGCHSGPMFSDYQLHRLGVRPAPGAAADLGDGSGRFRTASLRNVTRTAPYMHDGTLRSLEAVFDFYARVDRNLDPGLRGLRPLDPGERADVAAFLEAVGDGAFDRTVPVAVPSGLRPGGDL